MVFESERVSAGNAYCSELFSLTIAASDRQLTGGFKKSIDMVSVTNYTDEDLIARNSMHCLQLYFTVN